MRSVVGMAIFSSCLVVGAAAFVFAQGQPEGAPPAAPGQGGAPGGGRAAPPPPQNLKVLPKDWTRQQVQALMQTFVVSLGQQPPGRGEPPAPEGKGEGCLHCHVRGTQPGPGGRGPQVDYPSDENPKKDVARKMIQMVMAANADYLKDVGESAPEKISCYTCHRGESDKPPMEPPNGWGRGGFSLLPPGPPIPQRGGQRGN